MIWYEDFHEYVMWGQKQNKKNPWKFWTVEMYSYLTNSFKIMVHESKSLSDLKEELKKQSKINY